MGHACEGYSLFHLAVSVFAFSLQYKTEGVFLNATTKCQVDCLFYNKFIFNVKRWNTIHRRVYIPRGNGGTLKATPCVHSLDLLIMQ
jgi:hypothetical protein